LSRVAQSLKHRTGSAMAGFSFGLVLVAVVGMGSATFPATAASQEGGPAAADRRELLVAHDTMRSERIDTVDQGQVQLLFADQASLSIAPHSAVVINEFVYDPQAQIGKLTATVTGGLLRYVGGQISKKTDVVFYTPTAAVSVRGGIALIKIEPDTHLDGGGLGETTEVFFLSGERICVFAAGQSQCATKFGTAITSKKGKPPSAPAPVTPEVIQALLNELQVANAVAPTAAGARSSSQTVPGADPTAIARALAKPPVEPAGVDSGGWLYH